jgi:hypothetical protein
VKAFGSVRAFNQKRYLHVTSIRPLKDFNELTCHMLEAIHVHMTATQTSQVCHVI